MLACPHAPAFAAIQLDGVPLHIVQHGHNREPYFFGEEEPPVPPGQGSWGRKINDAGPFTRDVFRALAGTRGKCYSLSGRRATNGLTSFRRERRAR